MPAWGAVFLGGFMGVFSWVNEGMRNISEADSAMPQLARLFTAFSRMLSGWNGAGKNEVVLNSFDSTYNVALPLTMLFSTLQQA
jgi:hypothetical protein